MQYVVYPTTESKRRGSAAGFFSLSNLPWPPPGQTWFSFWEAPMLGDRASANPAGHGGNEDLPVWTGLFLPGFCSAE